MTAISPWASYLPPSGMWTLDLKLSFNLQEKLQKLAFNLLIRWWRFCFRNSSNVFLKRHLQKSSFLIARKVFQYKFWNGMCVHITNALFIPEISLKTRKFVVSWGYKQNCFDNANILNLNVNNFIHLSGTSKLMCFLLNPYRYHSVLKKGKYYGVAVHKTNNFSDSKKGIRQFFGEAARRDPQGAIGRVPRWGQSPDECRELQGWHAKHAGVSSSLVHNFTFTKLIDFFILTRWFT